MGAGSWVRVTGSDPGSDRSVGPRASATWYHAISCSCSQKMYLLNGVSLPEHDCPTSFGTQKRTKLASEPSGLHVRAGVVQSGKQRFQVVFFLFFTSTAASFPGYVTPSPLDVVRREGCGAVWLVPWHTSSQGNRVAVLRATRCEGGRRCNPLKHMKSMEMGFAICSLHVYAYFLLHQIAERELIFLTPDRYNNLLLTMMTFQF